MGVILRQTAGSYFPKCAGSYFPFTRLAEYWRLRDIPKKIKQEQTFFQMNMKEISQKELFQTL